MGRATTVVSQNWTDQVNEPRDHDGCRGRERLSRKMNRRQILDSFVDQYGELRDLD